MLSYCSHVLYMPIDKNRLNGNRFLPEITERFRQYSIGRRSIYRIYKTHYSLFRTAVENGCTLNRYVMIDVYSTVPPERVRKIEDRREASRAHAEV